jgi:hypothetical protein
MSSNGAAFAAPFVFGVCRRATCKQAATMRFAYYDRLSPSRKRVYRKSDGIEALALPPDVMPGLDIIGLRAALSAEDRTEAQRRCQRIVDALTSGYHVPPIRVRVLAQRPADGYGELPAETGTPARISVWMRTARKRHVVAFKSFLRTLCHELCHHLDYELFALEETFHTEGFYKRESGLANALLASDAGQPPIRLMAPGDIGHSAE